MQLLQNYEITTEDRSTGSQSHIRMSSVELGGDAVNPLTAVNPLVQPPSTRVWLPRSYFLVATAHSCE